MKRKKCRTSVLVSTNRVQDVFQDPDPKTHQTIFEGSIVGQLVSSVGSSILCKTLTIWKNVRNYLTGKEFRDGTSNEFASEDDKIENTIELSCHWDVITSMQTKRHLTNTQLKLPRTRNCRRRCGFLIQTKRKTIQQLVIRRKINTKYFGRILQFSKRWLIDKQSRCVVAIWEQKIGAESSSNNTDFFVDEKKKSKKFLSSHMRKINARFCSSCFCFYAVERVIWPPFFNSSSCVCLRVINTGKNLTV